MAASGVPGARESNPHSVPNALPAAKNGVSNGAVHPTLLSDIRRYGIKAAGHRELILHAYGKRLSARARCRAQCYYCMGFFADGKTDCPIPECPLYPLQPYHGKGVDPAPLPEEGS